ncbi:MAG: hypothetical protein H0W33_06915 [Gammaproteobacteria bacterium]|nr:hypothetical protein [Gammaproteobacteria bacterium]
MTIPTIRANVNPEALMAREALGMPAHGISGKKPEAYACTENASIDV